MIDKLTEKLKGQLVQTHTSWVILLEGIVYKIKKPVNFGFLDYSTLEKRKENCEREVILNKRLCHSIYLGVVPISLVDDEYSIEDSTNVIEYAVKMKRIPQERLLINMLNKVSVDDIKRLAEHIASFHLETERRDDFGRIEVMRFNTDENFMQTEKYIGITVEKEDYKLIVSKTERFYKRYGYLFEKRIKDGRIRDGHGDMRLEHVAFLNGKVCIFDCIEFNERFRCGDVLNDMCFLSMELELYGKEGLAKAYEEHYKEITQDEEFEVFLPFFKCYRAYVRGKVNSFLLDDPNYQEKERVRAFASKLFKLSRRYAEGLLV
ncbi:MAG: gluconokinase [Aquificaceae bacterium]